MRNRPHVNMPRRAWSTFWVALFAAAMFPACTGFLCSPFPNHMHRYHQNSVHTKEFSKAKSSFALEASRLNSTQMVEIPDKKNTASTADFAEKMDRKFVERAKNWIVLVDDDEGTRTAVGDYLYDQGFEITACADAEALLQVCRNARSPGELPRVPDIIVSDIRMPGTDGIQLLEQIRADERLKRVPVVLLTAKALTQDRIAGYRAGADAYIPKPFDPDELVAILDNRIARKKQQTPKSNLWELRQGLLDIKELMKQNKAHVVQKTDVYLTLTEREVLQLLCEGLTNSEIAQERNVSAAHVTNIINRMYTKTEVETRTQLVRWAIQTGYVPPR